MPYRVTFELDAFNGTRDASESHADLGAMLDCLVAIDTNYLVARVGRGDQGRNPAVPLLYASGVRYEVEPIGAEFWRDIPTILRYWREGGGSDCEDLVCWQVAELRVRFGVPARPVIIPQWQPEEQSFLYHIQTWTPVWVPAAMGPMRSAPSPQGIIDDPSARLGMPTGDAAPPRRCLPGQPNCAGVDVLPAWARRLQRPSTGFSFSPSTYLQANIP